MSSNATTLENLQTALEMEMTAAHQYQLHAHVLDDWGLDKLASRMRDEMHEEMGHLDQFIERLLFLDTEPKVKMAKTPDRAKSLKALFEADLGDEKEAIRFYSKAAQDAAEEGDIGSRALFEGIVMDEEGHMDWLRTQLDLIERIGEQNYAAKFMSGKGSDSGDTAGA